MTVIALGSVSGAPGVSRLAIGLAAAWPEDRRRVLVEADPDGGRLGAELGVGVEPGLMALALAARTARMSADDLLVTGAAAAGSWFLVPAPPSSEQASSALAHAATTLADVMVGADDDVWIVDTGRLSTRSAALPFALVADETVLVTAGHFPALLLVPHRVAALQRAGCRVSVVIVEPTSWAPAEMAAFTGADVLVVMPRVRAADRPVRAMRGANWRPWWRSVDALAAQFLARRSPPAALDSTHPPRPGDVEPAGDGAPVWGRYP